MFNNVALDVVIGLVFIFLLYSLLASIVQEIIATKLSFRAKILEKAILRMLEDGKTTSSNPLVDSLKGFYQLIFRSNNLKDKRFATAFYTHPLLKYLAENSWFSKPDYISSKNFSKTMIDLLHGIDSDFRGTNILRIKQAIESGILNISLGKTDTDNPANQNYIVQKETKENVTDINPETKLFLQSLLSESKGDIEKFKLLLENWFDDTMQRATGWYKRYTQYILVIIGFLLAFIFNVDSIAIGKILAKDKKAREQIVQMAIAENDKYKVIIDNQKSRLSDSLATGNDSILKATYRLIQDDADKATKILGLGRPWKDSCKICKDSTEKINLTVRKSDTKKISVADVDFHKQESIRIDSLLKPDSIKKLNRDSLLRLKLYHDTLFIANKKTTQDDQRLMSLGERCAYIKQATIGRWNKYSPNQEGGWETFAGWLITALAISLGAPFWYDLLSKLINIKNSGDVKKTSSTQTATTSAGNSSAPAQTININTNPGEEAVG